MQAVILAGGKGTRLAERLKGRPKPLIELVGVPLLERQILNLKQHGVDDVVLLVNHASTQIEEFCGCKENFGLRRLRLINDGKPLGTAGALLACVDQLAERFLVIYGDTLFNIEISRFLASHIVSEADATLFIHPNDHPFDSDLVEVEDNRISAFYSKPHPSGVFRRNLVNAAFYLLERKSLMAWREFSTPADFGRDLFPAMVKAGANLHAYNSFEYIKDVGTPDRLDRACQHIIEGVVSRGSFSQQQACVFLDRDGTLNELRNFVRAPEELVVFPTAAPTVRRFNDAEYRVALITNQPVIARGECSFADLYKIHAKLECALSETGAYLDRLYFCPHHPDAGFPGEVRRLKIRCNCRKPQTGLLQQAAFDLNADLQRSWMIGDSSSDVLVARNAGVRSILVQTGEAKNYGKYLAFPDFTAQNIGEAADLILLYYPRIQDLAIKILNAARSFKLVFIGGLPQTGKTTFASVLAHELRRANREVHVIPLDAWVESKKDQYESATGYYGQNKIFTSLSKWLLGEEVEIKIPPFYQGLHDETRMQLGCIKSGDVVIVEGVLALNLSLMFDDDVLKVRIEGKEESRLARVVSQIARCEKLNGDIAQIYAIDFSERFSLSENAICVIDFIVEFDSVFQ